MSDSKIQWTEKTWNPVTGCTKVSAGCDHCYASTLHNQRYSHTVKQALPYRAGEEKIGATIARLRSEQEASLTAGWLTEMKLKMAPCYDTPFAVVQCHEDRLREPMSWRKGAKVFTCSMGDIFHEDVPDAFLDRIFAVMALTPQHTFQVLTKRPERARLYLRSDNGVPDSICDAINAIPISKKQAAEMEPIFWPLPNVWLGTSVEDQAAADTRIPDLLATPAAVHFLSCEPLLGPVDLNSYADAEGFEVHTDWLRGRIWIDGQVGAPVPGIDWVIIGGESGAGARPMDLAWVRSLLAQCRAAGVAPFVKQLGAKPFDSVCPTCGRDSTCNPLCPAPELKLRDRHGGDWDEWPADLRVREFPGGGE